MKEYKGYGGSSVTINGDDILIKQLLLKEECSFSNIKSISFKEPSLLMNGNVTIITQKGTYPIAFLKKDTEKFRELYDLIYNKLYNPDSSDAKSNDSIERSNSTKPLNDTDKMYEYYLGNNFGQESSNSNSTKPLNNANDMYEYCVENNFGQGTSKVWGVKHFSLIESNLSADEKVLMCFIGLHNYKSMTKHDSNFAYAITNKRIIMAQMQAFGEVLQTVSLQNLNDITLNSGAMLGTITIDTIKEEFNVGVNTIAAKSINNKIHEILMNYQQNNNAKIVSNQGIGAADEIKKFKELLDLGIISQEEFDIKKKQLLGI